MIMNRTFVLTFFHTVFLIKTVGTVFATVTKLVWGYAHFLGGAEKVWTCAGR